MMSNTTKVLAVAGVSVIIGAAVWGFLSRFRVTIERKDSNVKLDQTPISDVQSQGHEIEDALDKAEQAEKGLSDALSAVREVPDVPLSILATSTVYGEVTIIKEQSPNSRFTTDIQHLDYNPDAHLHFLCNEDGTTFIITTHFNDTTVTIGGEYGEYDRSDLAVLVTAETISALLMVADVGVDIQISMQRYIDTVLNL